MVFLQLADLKMLFSESPIVVETVNDLIKMQLKDYLASGWSLERRLMAKERKRGGVLHIHPF